jgi:hypothetical protein
MSSFPATPSGLVIAIQYWIQDVAQALRLARLIADIEKFPRKDATVALVRRFDMEEMSAEEHTTVRHVRAKFPVLTFRAKREGTGHPNGPNAMAAGTMDHLSTMWRRGYLHRRAALLVEADGCPLRTDWLDCLVEAHQWTVLEGKAITGARMSDDPHTNGGLIMQFPFWVDHPSLHETPDGCAWDLHHADTILAATRATSRMVNYHGSRNWTPESLAPMSRETAYVLNVKDDSCLRWAEKALVRR